MKRTPLKRTRFKRKRSKSLRKQLWPEFSLLIRVRDGQCRHGGVCGGSLQASHIYPKGSYPLLELFPLNVKALCWRHHIWWHSNPLAAHHWYRETFPQWWQDRLEAMKVMHLDRKGMSEVEIREEWVRFGLGKDA